MRTWASAVALRRGIPRVRSAPWGAVLGVLLIAVLAVIAGMATALFGTVAAVGIAALAVGLATIMVPVPWLVAVLYFASFIITGQLVFFARLEKALWLPFLIGAVLLVRYPGELLIRRSTQAGRTPGRLRTFQVALVVYFVCVLGGSLINRVGLLQVVVTAKEYFFLWGVYLVIAGGLLSLVFVRRLWLLLPWLMVLQLPLVLYQRFVVAPSRAVQHLGAEWDAVVGAFGGNPEGGGASGAMGVFCVCAMALVAHAWRNGLMSRGRALLLLSAGFACVALAEVKFAVLLIPLVFGVAFAHPLLRRPLQGLGVMFLALTLSLSILLAYKAQYSTSQHAGSETLSEYFDSMFSSSVDAGFVNRRTGEIGRVAAIRFWWQQHGTDNATRLLVGHGMGSTRVGNLVVGEAAKGWPFNIARSSLAILLWETGVLGTLTMILALSAAAWRAHRLAGSRDVAALDRTLAAVAAAVCVAVLAGLIYNTDLFYSHQTQLLLLLALGLQVRLDRSPLPVAMQHARRPAGAASA